MPFGFMNRLRHGYGNIYTPHAGSMIIQVQRETGLANRTIIISERKVALLRFLWSRIGLAAATVFLATWLLFAIQSVRVPALSVRIAELERDNRRIDSLQVALSRMHGRYEQVRQMLGTVGGKMPQPGTDPSSPSVPNVSQNQSAAPTNQPPVRDTTASAVR